MGPVTITSRGENMLFDELKKALTKKELKALEYLEKRGFSIMTECRLDDCKTKDGQRTRTFSRAGRYDLVIGLKSIQEHLSGFKKTAPEKKKEPTVDELFAAAMGELVTDPTFNEFLVSMSTTYSMTLDEIKADAVKHADDVIRSFNGWKATQGKADPDPAKKEPKEEGDNIVDNFFMDLNNWKRLNREAFFTLVTEEAVDDLKMAPADVQADVKEKFDRLCDSKKWPL